MFNEHASLRCLWFHVKIYFPEEFIAAASWIFPVTISEALSELEYENLRPKSGSQGHEKKILKAH